MVEPLLLSELLIKVVSPPCLQLCSFWSGVVVFSPNVLRDKKSLQAIRVCLKGRLPVRLWRPLRECVEGPRKGSRDPEAPQGVLQQAPTRRSGTRRYDIRHAAIRPPATQISCHRHLMAPSHAAITSYCYHDSVPPATLCHPGIMPLL